MEADITSQAVGLASNTDFSLWSLFIKSRLYCKISNTYVDWLLYILMGNHY